MFNTKDFTLIECFEKDKEYYFEIKEDSDSNKIFCEECQEAYPEAEIFSVKELLYCEYEKNVYLNVFLKDEFSNSYNEVFILGYDKKDKLIPILERIING